MRRPHEIGSALRSARQMQGLTQAEVAAAAGVSAKWLSDAERGKDSINLGLMLAVLDVLGYWVEFVPRPAAFDLDAHLDRVSSGEDEVW